MAIDKITAGTLYSYGYKLKDSEGNVWDIMAAHTTNFKIFCPSGERFFDNVFCDFSEIGTTYKILARPLEMLTKEIEGKVPLIECGKLAYPQYEWRNELVNHHTGVVENKVVDFWFFGNDFMATTTHAPSTVGNQLSLFQYLYSLNFNIGFPENTTTDLI